MTEAESPFTEDIPGIKNERVIDILFGRGEPPTLKESRKLVAEALKVKATIAIPFLVFVRTSVLDNPNKNVLVGILKSEEFKAFTDKYDNFLP